MYSLKRLKLYSLIFRGILRRNYFPKSGSHPGGGTVIKPSGSRIYRISLGLGFRKPLSLLKKLLLFSRLDFSLFLMPNENFAKSCEFG